MWQCNYGKEIASVATSSVVLGWLCDSPRTGCTWRITPYINVTRTSNNRVIMACELYCCLLPQCEALCICRSGFPIATLPRSGIVLYRCFWRVLMSILCLVMHLLCVYAVKLLSGFFWNTIWLFLMKTGWQPCFDRAPIWSWNVYTPEVCSRGGRSHFFRVRLRSCSKIFESGSGNFLIWESDSCSDSGCNHRFNRNLSMFYLRNDLKFQYNLDLSKVKLVSFMCVKVWTISCLWRYVKNMLAKKI